MACNIPIPSLLMKILCFKKCKIKYTKPFLPIKLNTVLFNYELQCYLVTPPPGSNPRPHVSKQALYNREMCPAWVFILIGRNDDSPSSYL